MSNIRPFNKIKLQWLALLSQDKSLSSTAIQVALYIITVHYNQDRGKAWPSYSTIAQAVGKNTKTVQRAIKELEINWLFVKRGNGLGHSTEFSPSQKSILAATELREKNDKIVTLRRPKGGQKCPKRVTYLSGQGGQNCPPKKAIESRYESNARLFVEVSSFQAADWELWLKAQGLQKLQDLLPMEVRSSKHCFYLPSRFPPKDQNESERFRRNLLQRSDNAFFNSQSQILSAAH